MKRILQIFCFVWLLSAATPPCWALNGDDAVVMRNLDIFNAIVKELHAFYVDSIDATESVKTAINAMLDEVDPYTEYIPESEQEDFRILSTGQYGGIGSYIMQRSDHRPGVYISGPYENSPAARAGLRVGDHIVAIDGDTVSTMTTEKVSARLKGQPGTEVEVTVARPYVGDDSIFTFKIIRENIKVPPVPFYGVTRGNLGYIALTTFNEQSVPMVREALLSLRTNAAVKAIVLDLRGNGGGLMESAVQLVGLFVPKGTSVLSTRGRGKRSTKSYKTTSEPIAPDVPLAVLIDGGSASASEITAGALQDLDRAVIIGGRSFGKGLVQATRPLPFDALLKVTTARYYIPSGRLIQEIDYSKRNADGSYSRTAEGDTLGQVFFTAHGREVRQGRGITPDITVENPEIKRLVYNIVRDHWATDWATSYAATHPTIDDPDHFEVTDSLFADFKAFIDPDRFHYDKVCEQGIEALRKTAKVEGYMNEQTERLFADLEQALRHDLSHDLDVHRAEIEKILAQELMTRYYYQRGDIRYDIRHDPTLDRAEEVLTDAKAYARTLSGK